MEGLAGVQVVSMEERHQKACNFRDRQPWEGGTIPSTKPAGSWQATEPKRSICDLPEGWSSGPEKSMVKLSALWIQTPETQR